MKCLNCDSEKFKTKKIRVPSELNGETLEVLAKANVCEKCHEPLMDSEQMNILRRATADAYREKHCLLTSEKIVGFRKTLGMSQRYFANYLGVGEASIKRWETYYVQDLAMDQHIRLKCDSKTAENNVMDIHTKTHQVDEFSGKRQFSFERFREATLFLIKNCKSPLFLNKAIFYADFLHFKIYQSSITGCAYAKLDHGPCPNDYRQFFQKMIEEKSLKQGKGHQLIPTRDSNLEIFSDSEKDILKRINTASKKDGGKKLFDLSHEEDAYKKSNFYQLISYRHAKKLRLGSD
ncbi:MAG: hypothetical protein COV44_07370 [Deltaproteobacteria bacterium CG11_big_fil_rev_8_21_14_0_20_45_16]|nr:MAG: hypothetical protein COV44_07370 [Deltaproteobacteria bacterium CG11_big_fil_rev_8_21_14_0_20_45_16]PIS10924.1 MAG: hypothetical protein COT73_06750 [Bdellovibrio sp. CG10_big_fil_rev_8_21_14_0_10_47_8]